MIEALTKRKTNFKWTGNVPGDTNNLAVIVPQFNEATSNAGFQTRLSYFNSLALAHQAHLDIIIIDDGSFDESLSIINKFQKSTDCSFYVAAVYPNGDKVGAIYLTISQIEHPYVILTDFDTDIVGLEKIFNYIEMFSTDPDLLGGYFRMLPFEGSGPVFNYQQLEYSIARGLYVYHQSDKSVPVMPGAGAIFSKPVLTEIYKAHSGLRSGEDREATLIGIKYGYKCIYIDDIKALTRPPLSFKALIKQRIRWNLGYVETLKKEKKFYISQSRKLAPIGVRFLLDFLWVCFICTLPLWLICLGLYNIFDAMYALPLLYIICAVWCVISILANTKETVEIKSKLFLSVLMFPLYKFSVDYISWTGAIGKFIKKK